MTSSLGSINLLEKLPELRETFYLLDYWFFRKGYNSGTARQKKGMGREHRASSGPLPQGPTPPGGHSPRGPLPHRATPQGATPPMAHSPCTCKCSLTQRLSKPRDFYGGFIIQIIWLNHWPLATELHLQPLSPPW